jgi:hypothetical protein
VVRAIQDQAALLCTFAPQHGYQSRYRAVEHAVHTARLDRALGVAAKYHVGN